MFPLGHMGLTMLAGEALRRRWPRAARWPLGGLAVGAMLPDVLDKPVGHLLLDLGNGRLVGHTLLFAAALAALAWAARSRPRAGPALACLAMGSATHLVLDQMWRTPATLLWPALGLAFPALHVAPAAWWEMLLTQPAVQAGEALGLLGAAWALTSRFPGWHRAPRAVLLGAAWRSEPAEPAPAREP